MRLFSNEERNLIWQRANLNHSIDYSENQYEVSIHKNAPKMRTRGLEARGIKGKGTQDKMCQYFCVDTYNALESWKQISPSGYLKMLVGSSCQDGDCLTEV